MNKLINKLKEEEQDFEFYPTTEEIIQEVGNQVDYVGEVIIEAIKKGFESN